MPEIALFVLSVIRKMLIVTFIFVCIPSMTDPKQTACSPPGAQIGGSGHHCKF